jgi:hypothetical protein
MENVPNFFSTVYQFFGKKHPFFYTHSNFKKSFASTTKMVIVHQAYPEKKLLSENPGH